MEALIREWDGETVVLHRDKPTDAWIVIAIHSTRLGPATGGTRIMRYPDLGAAVADAQRLAAGMTYKYAVPGISRGGGKAVIFHTTDLAGQSRDELLRRYGRLLRRLGGLFYTGPDVGTSPRDMDVIAETGAPYVFSRTPAAGGAGSSGPFTALGVFTGIRTAVEYLHGDSSLSHRRVLVQGAGSVGAKLIEYLRAADAEVIFTEVDDEIVARLVEDPGVRRVPEREAYTTECDVFAPCALGGVLNSQTIPQLKCRVVAGGANNQLAAPEDVGRLVERGILYLPDYVLNVGGAMAITGMETEGWTRSEAEQRVSVVVRSALLRILELTSTEGITTEAAARRIAEDRLASASC